VAAGWEILGSPKPGGGMLPLVSRSSLMRAYSRSKLRNLSRGTEGTTGTLGVRSGA
jgi:hypothetical protein